MKRAVRAALEADDFEVALEGLLAFPLRSLCSPLVSFLSSRDEATKQRAVTALGAVVAELAGENMEAARDVLRRLHWSLTEEAGSIGWGAPEAMGEILARHAGLAREFASLLLSYAVEFDRPDHLALLRGALWGIGRLAHAAPALLREKGAIDIVVRHLDHEDAAAREFVERALAHLRADNAESTGPRRGTRS